MSFLVFPNTDQLLGAWGRGMDLWSVHPVHFDNLFVNVDNDTYNAASASTAAILSSTMYIESPSVSNITTPASSNVTQYHLCHLCYVEREMYFDGFVASDTAFCNIYGGDWTLVAAKTHSIGVTVHELSLTHLVSMRVGDGGWFCSSNTFSLSSSGCTRSVHHGYPKVVDGVYLQ